MSTDAYFSAMNSFQFEVQQRQDKRALTHLRRGLKLTAAALEAFRAAIAPAETPVIDLSRFLPEVRSPIPEKEETDSPQFLSETLTLPSDRLPLSAETLITANGTWLICTAREQPNGSSASIVMRRDRNGERLSDIVLPFKTLRVRANDGRRDEADFSGHALIQAGRDSSSCPKFP